MFKSEKGITLVALVITIVILIILATVSISFAVNDGLFTRAQEGADLYVEAADQEQSTLNLIDSSFANLMGKYGD